jgi:hypothetical protein
MKTFQLTFIVIFGGDGKNRVLNVLVFIDLCFIKGFVKVRRVVVLIGNTNANKFRD